MRKFRMLILTDHKGHSSENSLYPLAKALKRHPRCGQIDVASRSNIQNDLFFKRRIGKSLHVSKVDDGFNFYPDGRSYKKQVRIELFRSYDVVWLRLPPPLSEVFLNFLIKIYPNQIIINDPLGILKTGSKAFLMNFPELCPPMKVCKSVDDIVEFKNQFPVVLKPFREYGGKGIVRIDGDKVWEGKQESTFDAFVEKIATSSIEYLGVKFLSKVSEGDKRIVVVNGKIMGASLRLPEKGSWICNIAMGGNSNFGQVDEDEIKIVERINPPLSKLGIVMYGVDTLMGDDGHRVLSEINTTSIGGLPQIAAKTDKPIMKETTDLIWNYIIEKILEEDVITNE